MSPADGKLLRSQYYLRILGSHIPPSETATDEFVTLQQVTLA
jgi:hypothetical protein